MSASFCGILVRSDSMHLHEAFSKLACQKPIRLARISDELMAITGPGVSSDRKMILERISSATGLCLFYGVDGAAGSWYQLYEKERLTQEFLPGSSDHNWDFPNPLNALGVSDQQKALDIEDMLMYHLGCDTVYNIPSLSNALAGLKNEDFHEGMSSRKNALVNKALQVEAMIKSWQHEKAVSRLQNDIPAGISDWIIPEKQHDVLHIVQFMLEQLNQQA